MPFSETSNAAAVISRFRESATMPTTVHHTGPGGRARLSAVGLRELRRPGGGNVDELRQRNCHPPSVGLPSTIGVELGVDGVHTADCPPRRGVAGNQIEVVLLALVDDDPASGLELGDRRCLGRNVVAVTSFDPEGIGGKQLEHPLKVNPGELATEFGCRGDYVQGGDDDRALLLIQDDLRGRGSRSPRTIARRSSLRSLNTSGQSRVSQGVSEIRR